MAELDTVGRLTEQQSKDMTDVLANKKRSYRFIVEKKFEAEQARMHKLGKPWCYRCAKLDFEQAQEDAFKKTDTLRKHYQKVVKEQGLSWTENNIPVDYDLEKYGKPSRFKLLKEEVIDKWYNRNTMHIKTRYKSWACIPAPTGEGRGCRIAIEFPFEEEKKK